MKRIYRITFNIYRITLISMFPLYIFAKFMVDMGGHNSTFENNDYLLLAFTIITPTLLTILNNTNKTKNTLKNSLRFTIVGLISINIGFFIFELYDSWLLYKEQNFGIADNIPVAIIIFSIILCSILLIGLTKNKV